ncbi:helix-turn-helix domain containing protein [Gordonia hongkongensis]|uniref:Helix-turn-helix domain containing protein n=1 Tax=Gordonia hongkongensis TaxID=1701090 RepID=A0AAX3TA18_9ACTN|nr:TetR/AcrR family transcriptional regulator [Gordonia hongkongensis]QIK49377.1 TetR/AcrR family transcriptional regulator [Gordonia terrae]WFP25703.1 helix-turn-helix domain containing protein [Gordonia hongkongensis]
MTSTQSGGKDTRDRLLDAAERLFAERGVDAVPMREISREAGSRNVIAGQYWFGDKEGLIAALLDRHTPDVESRRHALLDAYEASATPDVTALAAALVRPLGAKLDQGLAGAGYLRTMSDLLTRPNPSVQPFGDETSSSMSRWSALLEPLLEPEAVLLHRRFLTARFVVVELALRAQTERTDHALFLSHLIDSASGQLAAPVSAETHRLRKQRHSKQQRKRTRGDH